MTNSRKKVVVRRLSPGHLLGYLPTSGLLSVETPDMLGFLDLQGKVQAVPFADVKYVAYVRDFSSNGPDPERLLRKTFAGRPRTEGLWLRLTLADGDMMEGLAAPDLQFADGWTADGGVFLAPPDTRGNTQRLFVPRAAIRSLDVVTVIAAAVRKQPTVPAPPEERQPDLFSAV